MNLAPRVVIVGAGVIGLTCALRLRELGSSCEVWTAAPVERTTSHVAAAFWLPYRIDPAERVNGWAATSYQRFRDLAADPTTGVSMRSGIELLPGDLPDPSWAPLVSGFRHARPDELRLGRRHGFAFDSPVVEMPIYLDWLRERLSRSGVAIIERSLESLAPALARAERVVNASGLGARELVGDRQLYPVRGQIVVVGQIGLERFWLDEYDPSGATYVIPRSRDIVLGGIATDHDESLDEDPDQTESILRRCVAIEPALAHAPRLAVRVGLRPYRARVRLESDADEPRIVHCYGHGGAGVTVSWGCAEEVAERITCPLA